ncbi:OPT oligopeptide transporter protein-domain-containing protein [Zopfochytrium polystomum]|nr:OPT oligopeptide transporter protein-domain-containing protein [Zopfochytrium polystomum]
MNSAVGDDPAEAIDMTEIGKEPSHQTDVDEPAPSRTPDPLCIVNTPSSNVPSQRATNGSDRHPGPLEGTDKPVAVTLRITESARGGDGPGEPDEGYDEVYDIVDAVVPRTDDPTIPAFTFRVLVLGFAFALVLASVNTLFTFRTNTFSLNPFIGVLLSYPLGHLLARVLPTTRILGLTLNPGRFTHKEHALIFIFCSTASGPAYALYNIVGQKYQLYQSGGGGVTTASALGFAAATQLFGYGLAGLCRRFLVRPAAMLWPGNLATVALLRSLHDVGRGGDDGDGGNGDEGCGRNRVLPSFVAPVLGAVSLLCYLAPRLPDRGGVAPLYAAKVARGLGSAQPSGGLGFLSLSFDWSIVGTQAPITTPLWALLNQFLGVYLILYIITPLLWVNSAFGNDFAIGTNPYDGPNGTGRFPLGFTLNSASLFDRNGTFVPARLFVDRSTLSLEQQLYDERKPILITTYFAMEYTVSFIVFTSAIVHVVLWYGKDIRTRFTTAMRDLDAADIHAKLIDAYPDVPDSWYLLLLAFNVVLAIGVCQWGAFDLPWWGVLLALALAGATIIPIGTIQAISGQQIGLNVMSEFLIGLLLPGRIAAVMSFKTLSYMSMSQGLFLVADLKLGHYLKVPPRAMFAVQLIATVVALVVNVLVAFAVYESFGRSSEDEFVVPGDPASGRIWRLQSANPPAGWSANNYNVFLNAGAIWGAIGPARFFGPGSPYSVTLWGLLVGAVAPVVPWLLHKLYPSSIFHLINIPLIAVFPAQVGGFRSDMLTPLVVGVLINHVVKRHRHGWWKKYAFVLSAALDSGTAIGVTATFVAFTLNAGYQILMPYYALNRADGEGCAAEFYLTCKGNENQGNARGRQYDYAADEYCRGIGFSAGVLH